MRRFLSCGKGEFRTSFLPRAFLILATLAFPWGCFQDEPHPFLSLQEFESASEYDSVLVFIERAVGLHDTLYLGPPEATRLEHIPAPSYRGEKILIIIEGTKAGSVVYRKGIYYDGGDPPRVDSTVLWKTPKSSLLISRQGWTGRLQEGDSLPLPDVAVSPAKLADKSVDCSSMNTFVAQLEKGMVRATGKGTVFLVCGLVSDPARKDSLFLQVVERPMVTSAVPDSLVLQPDTLRVAKDGPAESFVLGIFPSTADQAVHWRSLDSGMATVDADGKVQGVREGTTKVRVVSARDSQKAGEAWVVVSGPVKVDSVRFPSDSLLVFAGGTLVALGTRVYPPEAAQACEFEVEDTAVARVENGQAKGLREGKSRIVARSQADPEKSDTLHIVIHLKVEVSGVDVAPDSLVLFTGGPDTALIAEVFPASVPQEVIWRLVPTGIAALDGNGRISAVSPGRADVVAISKADSLVRDTARITVKRDVPQISVGRPDTVIGVGSVVAFFPRVIQEYGGISSFAWDLDGDGKWDDSSSSVPDSLAHAYAEAGLFEARFHARDGEGNQASAAKKIRVVTGPQVMIHAPADGHATRDRNVEVIWTVNGRPQDSLTVEVLRVQGPNTVTRTIIDSTGETNSASVTVYWDTVPPAVPVMTSSPWANTRTPTWTWSGGGGGIGQFRVSVDVPIPENAPSQKDTFFTALTELNPGLHTLLVEELDAAGNRSASARLALRIDMEPPKPPAVSADTSPTRNRKPAWSWKGAGGGAGLYRLRLGHPDLAQSDETNATRFASPADLGEGAHILYVQERDSAGNWSTSGFASAIIDLTPPPAPAVDVSPTSPTRERRPTWSWNQGSGGMGVFRFSLDSLTLDASPEDTAKEFRPAQDLAEGTHTLFVQERDSAGNFSSAGYRSIRIDLTPPGLPAVTSAETRTTNTRPTWTWRSGGNGGAGIYRCRLDDSSLMTGAQTILDTGFTPSAGLSPGWHTLYIQERDSAGNWSKTGSHKIRLHGQTGYAAGSYGVILKSTDAGGSWVWRTGGAFHSVRFADAARGYAVGGGGLIVRTTDGGANWTALPSVAKHMLRCVTLTNANTVYAVGDFGTIVKTSDGGDSWTSQPSGTGAWLVSVFFTSPSTGYATGEAGTILKTTDGGESWDPRPSGTSQLLNSILFLDTEIGYAVGGNGTILKTTNAGSTWSTLSSGTNEHLRSIYFTDSNTGYVVGDMGTMAKTTNGGISWSPMVSGVAQDLYSIQFTDAITGYVVGWDGIMLKTTDAGAAWTPLSTGAAYQNLFSIQFTDNNTGYAVGWSGAIIKTIDGGQSWTPLSSFTAEILQSMCFPDSRTGFAAGVGVGGRGIIIKTEDGGDNWSTVPIGATNWFSSIFFHDADNGYAIGPNSTFVRTADGGATWTNLSGTIPSSLYALHFTDAKTGFAAGGNGALYKTTDAGTSWHPLSSGTNQKLSAIYFTDSSTGYVVGDGGTIVKTADAGRSWNKLSSGTGNSLASVHFTNANIGYAAGWNGTIIKSTDAGGEWAPLSSESLTPITSIFFTDANTGYAPDYGGYILKTMNRGTRWFPVPALNGYMMNSVYFP